MRTFARGWGIALSALLWLPPGSLAAQAGPAPLTGLDQYIEQARTAWKVPGLAIAIVKNDSVVYARGFGVRTLGRPEPVDQHTLFAIGSCSKAFTATLVAMLVERGKLSWDDPVSSRLPGFQLYDPYVTRELTVRDLLTHRSGLSRGDLLWYATNRSRDEIVHDVRNLKPSWSFRSRFGYQNIMYLTAGQVVAAVEGQSWDRVVRERIFLPLGMLETNSSVRALDGLPDVASPQQEVDDTIRVISWRNIDNIAPAGSINSSVVDMAQWIRLQLGSGRLGERRLVDSATLEETHTPQTVLPRVGWVKTITPDAHLAAYGMGWFLSDYHGRLVAQHGGNIDGMSALVGLLPEEHLGLVILTNLGGTGLPTGLMYRIFDQYLGLAPHDWSREMLATVDSALAQGKAEQAKQDSSRVPGTAPSLPLDAYSGSYADSLYGEASVALEAGQLVLRFGPASVGDLEHWHYDTFRARWRDRTFGKSLLTFSLGPDGKVSGMKIDLGEPNDFRRVP
jgi:CubicO group peptidase (beta-lactamase class C family)